MKISALAVIMFGLFSIHPLTSFAATKEVMFSAEKKEEMNTLLKHYWSIEQSLAEDTLVGVKEAAELMIPAARGLKNKALSDRLQKDARSLAASAGDASGHSDLGKTREDFKRISTLLAGYLKKNPQSEWTIYHCPMAKSEWVQKSGSDIQNPFYGKEMQSCGAKVESP